MAARNALANGRAEGRLDGIELGRHMEVEVEPAVIHSLEREREFARGKGARDAGEACHTPDRHGWDGSIDYDTAEGIGS